MAFRHPSYLAMRMWSQSLQRIFSKLVDTCSLWAERHAQRRALAKLDDYMLKDIGIGRAEAMHEYYKPFWRK
jgi:uncharacterized protein YjiS (DUF1127 family)